VFDSDRVHILEHFDGDWWAECLICTAWVSQSNRTRREAEQTFGRHLQHAHADELVAAAIADAKAREALARLADEQAALRRVATLVAQGTSPQDLFAAVAEEVGGLLAVGSGTIGRYESDGTVTSVASWSTTEAAAFPIGVRWPTQGTNVAWMVFQTGRAARIDDFSTATDPIGIAVREAGIKSAVGSPIVVEGNLWGVVAAASTEGPLPPDTEAQLASFTELAALAIANADAQAALSASRARVIGAADEARRGIQRDLHDGAQQGLVSLALQLREAQDSVPAGADELAQLLDRGAATLKVVLEELSEIAHGLHPTALAQGGLPLALNVLARRSAVPVRLDVRVERRLPEPLEICAYYVIAEALTNTAKHASASEVRVEAVADGGVLRIEVRDDGQGGAAFEGGSGIVGLKDRVDALGGSLVLDSPRGGGTTLAMTLPLKG